MNDFNHKYSDVWKTAGTPIAAEGIFILKDTNLNIFPTEKLNEFIIQEELMGMAIGFMDLKFEVSECCRYKVKVDPSALLEKQNGVYIGFADLEVEDDDKIGSYHIERVYIIGYVTHLQNMVILAAIQCPNVHIVTYESHLNHCVGRICEIEPIEKI